MKENFNIDLRLFDAGNNVNTTEGYANANKGTVTPYTEIEGLSDEMRTYYSDYLIDNAEPKLIHDQFAQKVPIPKGNGKTVQFRKYDPLPKLTVTLKEGVTPDGQSLNMSCVEATVHQYGGYVELSDLLLLSAVDNNLLMATKLLGAQAGRTLDTITREVLCGGTNVQYAAGQVSARHLLVGGKEEGNHYLTVDCIKRAVRTLKSQNAEKIDGAYVCIIHPDCAYDLTNDLNWKYPYQYAAQHQLFEGEIGMIEGVRFVESTEAKVFRPEPVFNGQTSAPTAGMFCEEVDPAACTMKSGVVGAYRMQTTEGAGKRLFDSSIVGKTLSLYRVIDEKYHFFTVCGLEDTGTAEYIHYNERLEDSDGPINYLNSEDLLVSAGGGADGRDVYATIVLGENAYGTTEIAGGGLEYIVKQLGSGGTADPLNQRATVGWKATKAAVRLMEPFMVRIETASSFTADVV